MYAIRSYYEIEVFPSQLIQEISDKTIETVSSNFEKSLIVLNKNEFTTFDFGTNLSGFIGSKISCDEPSKIIFYFDELLTEVV